MQKTEGNMDDVHRVINNLKEGMVWNVACRTGEFMPVEKDWYEKNKALFYTWLEQGIPPPPGLAETMELKPVPLHTATTPDGKVWAIYRNKKGDFYREEIKTAADLPPPDPEPVKNPEPERMASPAAPEFSPVPSKNKVKEKW